MVDGRLIENLHVDDARRVLAWADACEKGDRAVRPRYNCRLPAT